jgi:hypothetical protein
VPKSPTTSAPPTPKEHLSFAHALWSGAQKMGTEQGGHLVIPFYLLIGFALEGALGLPLSRGLRVGRAGSMELIATISPHYEHFRFKYEILLISTPFFISGSSL